MKYFRMIVINCSLLLLAVILTSCVTEKSSQNQETELAKEPEITQPLDETKVEPAVGPTLPAPLPVRYQTASYLVDQEAGDDIALAEESKLKVGARITSTRGPQPLWDIVKRLAALKKFNVSWASDVDQQVLVDVDIGANDDFFEAIDNMLRQVEYYHEMEGSTIVIKYKETRQFHVAMPFTKQVYDTATGGNVLGSSDTASNIAGTIRLDSKGNEFDIWQNIVDNMDAILATWSTTSTGGNSMTEEPVVEDTAEENADALVDAPVVSRQVSSSGNKYTIDKPVGLITVHAPRPLLDKLDIYFKSLTKELYKQVSIEAKILEVNLSDHSAIGLDWNMLLTKLSTGTTGASYDKNFSKTRTDNSRFGNSTDRSYSNTNTFTNTSNSATDADGETTDTSTGVIEGVLESVATSAADSSFSTATILTDGLTKGIGGAINLASFTFDSFLNAVNDQGQATILANPKISVLNGQPALITVGRNVTYIDSIDSDVSAETGIVTYSVETERILSGVGLSLTANILDDNEIILSLVPVTSELLEPIYYEKIGLGTVGLPIVNIREMSTTVRVKNDEMLVIGGLISSVTEDEGTFVPGTSNIPFFKYLFGYEEKTMQKRELIILLRPRII